MTTLLPGCMMPDGAEPCDAFTELQDERDRLKAINTDLRGALIVALPLLERAATGEARRNNSPSVQPVAFKARRQWKSACAALIKSAPS